MSDAGWQRDDEEWETLVAERSGRVRIREPMTARVLIDPNVRVRGNQTYAGIEDVEGDVTVGSRVEVYESESGLTGLAVVTEVDYGRGLVYFKVDWETLG